MNVAILGSGPAGMFAAHAVAAAGHKFDVITNTPERSVLRGAQYLHEEIPGLTNPWPDGRVAYKKIGTPEGYAKRVYGHMVEDLSWNFYRTGWHKTWNLRRAYRKAFDLYKHHITAMDNLTWKDVPDLTALYDLVINTVPLTAFREPNQDYGFISQDVWIKSWTEHVPIDGRDTIIYNGMDPDLITNPWYRYSRLYGWCAEEYGSAEYAPEDAVQVRKPLSVERSPVPPSWLCVGRYGAWTKRALTHDAFYNTVKHLEEIK